MHRSTAATLAGPLLQRKCACGAHTPGGGTCESCAGKKRLQRKLTIGSANDPLEHEADRIAEQVIGEGGPIQAGRMIPRIQRASSTSSGWNDDVPESVHRVLGSPGHSLEAPVRHDMEERFGQDFSQVRIHHDGAAAQSAHDVDAQAYTSNNHIVFGSGQFRPSSPGGQRLLAHELTHVLQQAGAPEPARQMRRACLPAAECAGPKATLTEFVADTVSKPENISKADKRAKACGKTPRDPSCTSDGHGAKAAAVTEIIKAKYASRLNFITGIFVNKDMPAQWGAVTDECANFTPPLAGSKCTFVPDTLEAEAKQYRSGNKKVGGMAPADWLRDTIGTIAHETEHARFDSSAPIAAPSATSCKFDDHKGNLSEMAAHFAEMHVFYRDALSRPAKDRFKDFKSKFVFWVTNGSEDLAGIVKDLRCKCECTDADHYITKTVESVAKQQKWDTFEANLIHSELREPKWPFKPKWPINPPTVAVSDLPDEAKKSFAMPD